MSFMRWRRASTQPTASTPTYEIIPDDAFDALTFEHCDYKLDLLVFPRPMANNRVSLYTMLLLVN